MAYQGVHQCGAKNTAEKVGGPCDRLLLKQKDHFLNVYCLHMNC